MSKLEESVGNLIATCPACGLLMKNIGGILLCPNCGICEDMNKNLKKSDWVQKECSNV